MKRLAYSVFLMATALLMVAPAAPAGSSLIEAIKNNDVAAIHSLAADKTAVTTAEADGTTPLHWAVYKDQTETVDLLLKAGADVKAPNRYGITPLYLASDKRQRRGEVQVLLKAGAEVNVHTPDGETALMVAARTGQAGAVKALLDQGADPNVKETSHQQTALMWASAEGNTEAVQLLAAHGAEVGARETGGFTALLFAIRAGHIDTVRALLKAGADVNQTTQYPPATGRRDFIAVRPGQKPPGGPSALVLAIANARYELASVLLDAGADPNKSEQGWTALHQITWARKPTRGQDNPAPAGSGKMDSLELVSKLVAKGADINAKMSKKADMGATNINNVGATPFFLAARTRDLELMKLLVKLGADPLAANDDNTTPLMVAAGVGSYSPGDDPGTDDEVIAAVKYCLELKGDPNTVDDNGETAMHGVGYRQVPAVVKILVEHGARQDDVEPAEQVWLDPINHC